MMPRFDHQDEEQAIVAGVFRLAFRWTGDRWRHVLEIGAEPSERVALAHSFESDPDRDDPARVVSPVFQELHFQGGDPEPEAQALLVGRAGPHHFSAVFSVREMPNEVSVEVDLAVRCRATVESLASTYVIEAVGSDLLDADTNHMLWKIANLPSGRLALEATSPARVALAEAGRRGAQAQVQARVDPANHTQRCIYHWRWMTES